MGKHPRLLQQEDREHGETPKQKHSLLQQEDREHSSLLQQEVPGVLPSAGEVSEPRPYSVKLHPAHNKFSE